MNRALDPHLFSYMSHGIRALNWLKTLLLPPQLLQIHLNQILPNLLIRSCLD